MKKVFAFICIVALLTTLLAACSDSGFRSAKGIVDGNVYFESQEYMDSMVEDDSGSVTGEMKVE